jgi:hypothetical protein
VIQKSCVITRCDRPAASDTPFNNAKISWSLGTPKRLAMNGMRHDLSAASTTSTSRDKQ